METNQAAIDALQADNRQLTQRYLTLVGRTNAVEIQVFWRWAREYTARDRADELLAAATSAAEFTDSLAAYKELREIVANITERGPSSDIRQVMTNPQATADWPDGTVMQTLLQQQQRWHHVLEGVQTHSFDNEAVLQIRIVWDAARWRAVGARYPFRNQAKNSCRRSCRTPFLKCLEMVISTCFTETTLRRSWILIEFFRFTS